MKTKVLIALVFVAVGGIVSVAVRYYSDSDSSAQGREDAALLQPVPNNNTYSHDAIDEGKKGTGPTEGFLDYDAGDPIVAGKDPQVMEEGSVGHIEQLFKDNDLHDILFITMVISDVTDHIPQKDELMSYLTDKGFTPYEERKGHQRTGFRREIRIQEIQDKSRLIKEFLSSYHENEGEYIFDRLYVGLDKKDYIFEYSVKEIDQNISGKFVRRVIKDKYARWDFADGSFVFINGEYEFGGEEIILYGKEWEIH